MRKVAYPAALLFNKLFWNIQRGFLDLRTIFGQKEYLKNVTLTN